jgi:UDP-2-acetamido-2,6-beta-L-arabino-hexul-4-ose reductase
MANVLITGINGFLGRNLQKRLQQHGIHVKGTTRSTSTTELNVLINNTDFIYHFAGEVKPESDEDAFNLSNLGSTKKIIDSIKRNGRPIPIVFASTVHAEVQHNAYGKTKREAEKAIEVYGQEHNVAVKIYRLPHVFGEGCKPNYNSVVSTWIYNRINDAQIIVYDRGSELQYVYVQDLVTEFIELLKNISVGSQIYVKPKLIFKVTLGELADLIEEFKSNIKKDNYKLQKDSFEAKLFTTYQYYYENNQ